MVVSSRNVRVICEVKDEVVKILVVEIGNRREAYRLIWCCEQALGLLNPHIKQTLSAKLPLTSLSAHLSPDSQRPYEGRA